jgi:hypothetical protein
MTKDAATIAVVAAGRESASCPDALNARRRNSLAGFGCGILADGSVSSFDVYQAKVVWDGRVRPVFVDEFDSTSLVGLALLRGYEYKMQVRAQGKVSIKRLPRL